MAEGIFERDGSCLCGACQYTVSGKVMMSALCHCKACSRAIGMSPVHLIIITPSDKDIIDLKSGNVKLIEGIGKMRHAVCCDCGVCIYQYPDGADFRAVYPTNFRIEDGVSCLLPKDMMPTVHVNYENRHYDWSDELPKFKVFPGGEMISNQGEILPSEQA